MKIVKLNLLVCPLTFAATLFSANTTIAQTYPTKPIRLIVAFAPGGATDTFARITAAELTRTLGQQVVVENRPGAGTTIAAEFVAKSAADGYTLLLTDLSTHAIMPSLYTKLGFNHGRDLIAVAPVSASPLIMAAHPSLGAKNAKELIALAKKNPGITCGNSGAGTVTHLAAEKFRTRAGIDLLSVNYKGGTTSTVSLMTGELSLIVNTIPAVLEHVKSKKLVAIGLTADKRSAGMKEQTTEILGKIDVLLKKSGTDKSKLLSAMIWITDMRLKPAMDEAWLAWADAKNLPARACVETRLGTPDTLVEIMVVAAQ